jgi:carboxyl-terminal processing protease
MKVLKAILNTLSRYGWSASLIVLGGFAAAFTWSSSDDLYSNIRIFDKTAVTITSSYVENIDENALIKAGIDGMMAKLDPYSRYLTGGDYDYLKQETDGEFNGIGVSLGDHHDTLTVESVLPDSPGDRRGIKPGDRLLVIDGVDISKSNSAEIRGMLHGAEGSKVNLSLHRPGSGYFNIDVEREKIEISPISYYGLASDGAGYIELSLFSDGAASEVSEAIKSLKRQGMKSLILDLRENPGGLLVESVKIASLFLPDGASVVETRGRDGQVTESFKSSGEKVFQSGELIILVNSQTASAAEIVAGAIQDHDRGIIIGSATFGKGLVQQIMQFSENSALKLTTAKYYLPSGRCLQKPDWSTFELVRGKLASGSDSLYRTISGRPVFGGGGILPDIVIDEAISSPYVDYLHTESCFFDYAVDYIRSHPVQRDFTVSDTEMEKFREFLKSRQIHFSSDERVAFNSFKEKLSVPNQRLATALNTIDTEITAKENWQFDSNYKQISACLTETIVRLSGGENALYEQVLIKSDPEIRRALSVINDGARYVDILSLD